MIYFNVYRFKDRKKNFVKNINFSVKLHDISLCLCSRILNDIRKNNVNPYKLMYVLENMYPENDDPLYIYVEKNKYFRNEHLIKLFDPLFVKNKYNLHDLLTNKFVNRIDNLPNIICNSLSISKCNGLLNYEGVKNSGIIFISDIETAEKISHIYNLNVGLIKNKFLTEYMEFDKLCVAKIDDLELIKKDMTNHTIGMFINSKCYQFYKNRNLYTVLGFNEKNFNFSFAFGKNEWYHNNYETSYVCAKRELLEEFRILYSGKYSHKILTDLCCIYVNEIFNRKVMFSEQKKVIII